MFKSINGDVPIYIADLISPFVGVTSTDALRNQNDITVSFCRTDISHKSCIPSSSLACNSSDIELRNLLSLAIFKYQL